MLIAGVFLLAGFVKGVIGLGLPTISMGLLVLFMPAGRGSRAADRAIARHQRLADVRRRQSGRPGPAALARAGGGVPGHLGRCRLHDRRWKVGCRAARDRADALRHRWHDRLRRDHQCHKGALAWTHERCRHRTDYGRDRRVCDPRGALSASAWPRQGRSCASHGSGLQPFHRGIGRQSGGGWTISLVRAPSALGTLAMAGIGMGLGQALRLRLRPAIFRICFFVGLFALGLYLAVRAML